MTVIMSVVVLVATMFVMHVLMIVAIRMPMRMPMIVVTVVVMIIGGGFVSTTFRLERRIDGDYLRAEAGQQRLDGRITLEPDPPLQHLDWHMAVAEMPGKPRQSREIGRPRFDQRLGLRHDLNVAAGVEHQYVIGTQPHRFREVEFDASAFDPEQKALLRLTLRMGQNQRIDSGSVPPFGGMKNACGAWHVGSDPMLRQLSRDGRSGSSGERGGGKSGAGGSETTAVRDRSIASLRWYSL